MIQKSLSDIFIRLRTYYQFAPSESTFIKCVNIKREIINASLERPLHLYLRKRQFTRDNLLLKSGRITHNGKVPPTDESLSPTTKQLVVLRWLEVLHPALHVANLPRFTKKKFKGSAATNNGTIRRSAATNR